jgi:fructosamine-3-kinase
VSQLPRRLRHLVEEELHRRDDAIRAVAPVSGGCINHGTRVESERGELFFLKWNPDAPAGMYQAEAEGLEALRTAAKHVEVDPRDRGTGDPEQRSQAPGRLRIPGVIAIGDDEDGPRWLLMEFIAPADGSPTDATLGRCLANVHGSLPPGDFGWEADNWIGSLPQDNAPSHSWGEFWRDRRIVPQLYRARVSGHLREADLDRLVDRVVPALEDVTRPELLHGDLWSGNTYRAASGDPVLIDPAIYAGDGEVDLAMTELFGGFDTDFYEAYREHRPVSHAYEAYRRDLYQLYYLLVHVNLFGRSYVAGARRAAERVLAALA